MLFLLYLYQQYNDTIAIWELRMHYWPKHLYGSQIRSNGKPVLKLLVCFIIQIPALPDTVLVGAIFWNCVHYDKLYTGVFLWFEVLAKSKSVAIKNVNYSCSWYNT